MLSKLILVLFILLPVSAAAQRSIPATWHHTLSCTRLVGYKDNEQLIYSWISTGTTGIDEVRRYDLEVKVDTWDQPFTVIRESPEKKEKERFTVTLHKLTDPKEMEAEFEHIVYENGKIKLRFAGVTRMINLVSHD